MTRPNPAKTSPTRKPRFGLVRSFLACFFEPQTLAKSLKVAMVVGPVLIAINHIDTLIQGRVDWACALKMALTFLVPFCVAGYATATTLMAQSGQADRPNTG